PELVVGRNDRELFSNEEALAIQRNDRRILQDAVTRTYEEVISTAAGPMTLLATKGPLLDARGNVVGTFGISRDITDRKRGEALLQESRAKLENVIESLNEGLIIWDVETGEVHWNRAALLMHGFDGKQQPNMNVSTLQRSFQLTTLDGQAVSFYDWPLNRVLRGESVSGLSLQVRRPELDLERIFTFNGSLARREDNQPMFALLSINDVTLSRRAEESARHAQRLEALGTLSAGVAHDFNNILFAIAGNVQLARLEVPESSPALEFLDEIGRASARAADLVRRILLFARSQESRRSAVELWPVVEDALKLLRPTLPAQIQITTSVADPGAVVRADTSQIHQVITNLVTNAAHAVLRAERPAPRQVRILLESIALTRELPCHGRSLQPGRYAHLTVEDDGCGMDEVTARRAFDPFFTTKPTGEGTGLGLSIVHGIVSNHEGAVGIESERGKGTRVHVYLPIATEAVVRVAAQGSSITRSKLSVLFIDDEQALVRVAERGLGRLGHRVAGFVSAQEGLRSFEREPDGFDVVVTDLSMPELSGFDVAETIRSRRPGLPILMMSGFVRPEDRERARQLGIRELLVKPSSIDQLAAAIDRCCAPALLEGAQRAPGHASGGA
ncbi:MAG TPA: ATP-binding protein, partial [Polyangiaceae bacterium]|nr:ATP-binding protein [Polyangiaceae bacterium]